MLQTLSPEEQQEVLDFVEFLEAKRQRSQSVTPSAGLDPEKTSVLTAAGEFIGCAEGPTDLSINHSYMEGYAYLSR
ncbi:MAG: DUF2281 domain-containing protein [Bacteroidota bacterium]